MICSLMQKIIVDSWGSNYDTEMSTTTLFGHTAHTHTHTHTHSGVMKSHMNTHAEGVLTTTLKANIRTASQRNKACVLAENSRVNGLHE